MEIKIIGKKNDCDHSLETINGNIKWCTKCGMLQLDVYDVGFVMLRREHHYPEIIEDKKKEC